MKAFLPLLAFLLPSVLVAAEPASKDSRPSILLCIADDWSWPHAGIYGDKTVKTPTFDRLAGEGALFSRAYCMVPSCTASRAALLTGQAAHRLDEGANLHCFLPKRFATYPDLLERSGYVVGMTGKGWGPGELTGSGRDRNPAGPSFKDFAAFLKVVPTDKPFCFWLGSHRPHRPYQKGSGLKAGLKPDNVQVPAFWPDTPEVRSDILDYMAAVQTFDQEVADALKVLSDAGRASSTLVVIASDNGWPFPRCKANLYDMGTHEPLAVRWPGKVKAGSKIDSFVSLADLAPTFLEAAGVKIPADMTGQSIVGLLTSGGKTGGRDHVFVERERHAHVRKGNLSYPSRAIRTERYLYIRNFFPDRGPAGDPVKVFSGGPFGDIDAGGTKAAVLALKGDKDKGRLFELCCGLRPAEELYDCQADPREMTNLVGQFRRAKIQKDLRARLDKWMTDTKDPRATNPQDLRWDKYPYLGKPGKKP